MILQSIMNYSMSRIIFSSKVQILDNSKGNHLCGMLEFFHLQPFSKTTVGIKTKQKVIHKNFETRESQIKTQHCLAGVSNILSFLFTILKLYHQLYLGICLKKARVTFDCPL